jgi:hypothetical protein
MKFATTPKILSSASETLTLTQQPPTPNTRLKNVWSFTSTPFIHHHGMVLKHRDNLTSPFTSSCITYTSITAMHLKVSHRKQSDGRNIAIGQVHADHAKHVTSVQRDKFY